MKEENKIHDIHLELMARACSIVWGVDIKTNSRARPVTYVRACFYKLARNYTNRSLSFIGGYTGKDHATITHALNKFNAYQLTPDFNKKYEECITHYKYLIQSPETLDLIEELSLSNKDIEINDLEMKIIYLKIQNDIIVDKIPKTSDDFIEEIRNLEPSLKREFKEYRWKPFKRLLETRVKH